MIHHWTLYMYTFPNGKRYIGATRRPLHHRQRSKESSWAGYKNCKLLWDAICQYGIDNIEQTILFEGDIEDIAASELEKYYIAHYKTNCKRYKNPSYGYNLGDGGEGTQERHLSEKTKIELRERLEKIAEARIGKPVSDDTRYRQRMAKLGTKRGPMSEETKRKIGLANSIQNMSLEERQRRSASQKEAIIACNIVTREKLFFNSGEEAANFFGVRSSSISRWINGTRNSRTGYLFSKATEEEKLKFTQTTNLDHVSGQEIIL